MKMNDKQWMKLALSLAESAASYDEVPIGALVVKNNRLVSTAFNRKERTQQCCDHAEIIAIGRACENLRSWRLVDCTLYSTLEPCLMCAGALYQARIQRVVFATSDPKAGALTSLYRIHDDRRLNHRFKVTQGVYQDQAVELLQEFFKRKREK